MNEARLDERRQKEMEGCVAYAYDLALAHCKRWGCLCDLEEAAGEAMLALGRAALKFDFGLGNKLTTYATPVVTRHLIQWSLRRLRRHRESFGTFGEADADFPEPADRRPHRPRCAASDDLDALLSLADRTDAEALRLRAICGLKWAEVGLAMGCSRREARAKAERAMAALKRLAG